MMLGRFESIGLPETDLELAPVEREAPLQRPMQVFLTEFG